MMLNKRLTADDIGSSASKDLAAFYFFQVAAGHVALPILVVTFLVSKVASRHILLVNLLLAWIGSAISSSIQFYVRGQWDSRRNLCIGQSAAVNSIPMLTNIALLSLVIHVWSSFNLRENKPQGPRRIKRIILGVLLIAPWLAFGVLFAFGEMLGQQHSDRVGRDVAYFYCSIDWPAFRIAVGVLSLLTCILSVGLEARTILTLLRYEEEVRDRGEINGIDSDLIMRLALFTVFQFTATTLNLASIWAVKAMLPAIMFTASTTLALFLIFAIHPEVFYAWMFWRHQTITISPPPTDDLPQYSPRGWKDRIRSPSLSTKSTMLSDYATASTYTEGRKSSRASSKSGYGYGHGHGHGPSPRERSFELNNAQSQQGPPAVEIIGTPNEAFFGNLNRKTYVTNLGFPYSESLVQQSTRSQYRDQSR